MATKQTLVDNLTKKLQYLSQEDARYAVDCILSYIKAELIKDSRIEIRGFGSLSLRKRKYANRDEEYNSVYYRMSKNVQEALENQ